MSEDIDRGGQHVVEPLSAPEWNAVLAETDYALRISDGTREGTWYFWTEKRHSGGEEWLYARRLTWTSKQEAGTVELKAALDDGTTQLVKRKSKDE